MNFDKYIYPYNCHPVKIKTFLILTLLQLERKELSCSLDLIHNQPQNVGYKNLIQFKEQCGPIKSQGNWGGSFRDGAIF